MFVSMDVPLDDDDINTNGDIVVAYLEDFDHRDRLTFMYGGGTGSATGVKVQDTWEFATSSLKREAAVPVASCRSEGVETRPRL